MNTHDDDTLKDIIASLKRIKATNPSLRVGQIISNAAQEYYYGDGYYIPDEELADQLAHYIKMDKERSVTMPTCRTCNKFTQHEVRTSDISLSTGWCSNGYPTDAWDEPPCHSDNDERNESEASE